MIELNIIESYIKKFNNVNILIDDIRLFDGKNQNYPNINEIVDWARKIIQVGLLNTIYL